MRARTSISALRSGVPLSAGDVSVPTMPRTKASGIEMMPGLASGNQAKSAHGISDFSEPETTGEKITRPTVMINPP